MRTSLPLLTVCTLIVVISTPTFAQQVAGLQSAEKRTDELRDDQKHSLVIHPQAESTPVLKHRLYPDRSKMFNRNAAIYYHRAARESADIARMVSHNNRDESTPRIPVYDGDNYEAWFNSPIDQMPVEDMKKWTDMHKQVFFELERSRLSDHCDWAIMPEREEGIDWVEILLDEVQQMRGIARTLALQARIEMRMGNYDKAIHHLASGFKIAHDLGQSETLVGNLVGIACAGLMVQQVRFLIQEPDAPNLYWALVDLPRPIADTRIPTRAELKQLNQSRMSGTVEDPLNAKLTPEGWNEALLFETNEAIEGMTPYNEATLQMLVLRGYPVAKQALLDDGVDPKRVEKMSPIQVVAIQQKRATERISQNILSALNLPYPQRIARLNETEEGLDFFRKSEPITRNSLLLPTFDFYLPATSQVCNAEARTERSIAALMTLEAIRAHAKATGSLPESLESIKGMPLPTNPATNMLFDYMLEGDVAELKDFGFNRSGWNHYKIRLAK